MLPKIVGRFKKDVAIQYNPVFVVTASQPLYLDARGPPSTRCSSSPFLAEFRQLKQKLVIFRHTLSVGQVNYEVKRKTFVRGFAEGVEAETTSSCFREVGAWCVSD